MAIAKVIILTGSYGTGHKRAAHALAKALDLNTSQFSTRVLDVTSLAPPRLDSLEKRTFLSGVTHFPSLYHYIYKKTQKNNIASSLIKKMNRVGVYRLISALEEEHPDLIVSTFPVASVMMSLIKQADWFTSVPLLTVITDYSVHSTWVNQYTDGYLVATQEVKQMLIDMNVDPEKIMITGIPIHPKFSGLQNKRELKEKYHIPYHQKVLLLMGGGGGIFGHFLPILRQLDKIEPDVRIVIICGQNRKIFQQFTQFSRTAKHNIQVEGFVHNMNEWMAIADLLITKPGGLTVSEAIASELPMIIYRPLGGQEADNTQFLLSSGISVATNDHSELIEHLIDLLNNPLTLDIMRTNMRPYSIEQRQSAKNAANAVAQFLSAASSIQFA